MLYQIVTNKTWINQWNASLWHIFPKSAWHQCLVMTENRWYGHSRDSVSYRIGLDWGFHCEMLKLLHDCSEWKYNTHAGLHCHWCKYSTLMQLINNKQSLIQGRELLLSLGLQILPCFVLVLAICAQLSLLPQPRRSCFFHDFNGFTFIVAYYFAGTERNTIFS